MLVDGSKRGMGTSLFGIELPTPLFMSPIGVLGICAQDGHGDLAVARAAARTGVPMVASTLSVDPLETVAAAFGGTPGFFQLYTPDDRELAASFVGRAEAAGFRAIVVTLDTWVAGWRPRDLARSSFPQLRGHCLANDFSDPVFRSRLARLPEEDPDPAVRLWSEIFGARLTWSDLPWLRSLTKLPLLLNGICHPDDVRRAIDGGIDGIYCSTHGGRQANGGVAALDMLPAVVEAAGRVPVLFDSGVRSGSDVVGRSPWAPRPWGSAALCLGPGPRGDGRGRPRLALLAGGGRPADGDRRLPDPRRPAVGDPGPVLRRGPHAGTTPPPAPAPAYPESISSGRRPACGVRGAGGWPATPCRAPPAPCR